MKFQSKPKIIEAEQFDPKSSVWPKGVYSFPHNNYRVYNRLHDTNIFVKPGDWIRIDNEDDIYPIADGVMKENYEAIL